MDAYTIVFFQLGHPPSHLVLMHRFPHLRFGSRWTGIGGKIETGETALECALREVEEETGITGRELTEFSRAIINHELSLQYFVGVDDGQLLPESPDGILHRVPVEQILQRQILFGTRQVLSELSRRDWDTAQPFSLIGQRDNLIEPDGPLTYLVITEGLQDLPAYHASPGRSP